MDKKHWINAAGGSSIDVNPVEELVVDSYRLVVRKLLTSSPSEQPHRDFT